MLRLRRPPGGPGGVVGVLGRLLQRRPQRVVRERGGRPERRLEERVGEGSPARRRPCRAASAAPRSRAACRTDAPPRNCRRRTVSRSPSGRRTSPSVRRSAMREMIGGVTRVAPLVPLVLGERPWVGAPVQVSGVRPQRREAAHHHGRRQRLRGRRQVLQGDPPAVALPEGRPAPTAIDAPSQVLGVADDGVGAESREVVGARLRRGERRHPRGVHPGAASRAALVEQHDSISLEQDADPSRVVHGTRRAPSRAALQEQDQRQVLVRPVRSDHLPGEHGDRRTPVRRRPVERYLDLVVAHVHSGHRVLGGDHASILPPQGRIPPPSGSGARLRRPPRRRFGAGALRSERAGGPGLRSGRRASRPGCARRRRVGSGGGPRAARGPTAQAR